MEDYFDRVEAQLVHLADRRRLGPRAPSLLAAVLSASVVAAVAGALLVSTRVPTPHHRAARPAPRPSLSTRPFYWSLWPRNGRCYPSTVRLLRDPEAGGRAIGAAPIRFVLGNRTDRHRAVVTLGTTGIRGWWAIEIVLVSSPAYQGTFLVRAARWDRRGTARFGDGGPPPGSGESYGGQTPNSAAGWRGFPAGLWVRSPGCYGLQVDGYGFPTQVLMLRAVLPAQPGSHPSR